MASLGGGQLMNALNKVREINPGPAILLTRGRHGAWFIRRNEVFSIPAIPQVESEFLVGAGDTFAAPFTITVFRVSQSPSVYSGRPPRQYSKFAGFRIRQWETWTRC